jgi:hypothetical protein
MRSTPAPGTVSRGAAAAAARRCRWQAGTLARLLKRGARRGPPGLLLPTAGPGCMRQCALRTCSLPRQPAGARLLPAPFGGATRCCRSRAACPARLRPQARTTRRARRRRRTVGWRGAAGGSRRTAAGGVQLDGGSRQSSPCMCAVACAQPQRGAYGGCGSAAQASLAVGQV